RRCQVLASRTPVRCSPCLPWKPFTAAAVAASYAPVVVSGSHASWKRRCCSSRTLAPLVPGLSTSRFAGTPWAGDEVGELGEAGGVMGEEGGVEVAGARGRPLED